MGIRSFIKNTAKSNVNVKGWSSWDAVKENGKTVYGLIQDMKPQNASETPVSLSFEEAMKKYGLAEKDITALMKKSLIIAAFCALLGTASLLWAIYLLFFKSFYLSCIVGFALSALMFSYAFREHFHYFQMKRRNLQCSAKEWFSGFFTTHQK